MPRLTALLLVTVACVGCFDDPKPGAPPPAGPGYDKGNSDDQRLLTNADCVELREQQVTLAAKEQTSDPVQQEQIAAKLRVERKDELAKWVKWCSGRIVLVKDLRCMKESVSLSGFLACGNKPDAGPSDVATDVKPG